MRKPPRKTPRQYENKLRASGCHIERKIGERLHPNQICVQLPGNRGHHIVVKADEQIGNLRKQIAGEMGVKERNWGIYIHQDNRLRVVDDTKRLDQVDRNGLHFYPRAVIR